MRVLSSEIPDVIIIEPQVLGDSRGFFLELWNRTRYGEAGLPTVFAQDNLSRSARGVLRGLHFQNPNGQGKLVTVLEGSVYDAAVDVRLGSPSFGRWVGVVLSGEDKRQLYIPPGFAHGFCVTSDSALFMYKTTELYAPEAERGITWNDPDLAIPWPLERPTLSPKDTKYSRLCDIDPSTLPKYQDQGRTT
jgi:dTDP-4-dehydrorhamnose 3,5-epimerase